MAESKTGSGKRGRPRVSNEDAGTRYEQRNPARSWEMDAWPGVVLAVFIERCTVTARRLVAVERQFKGETVVLEPAKEWFRRWYPRVRADVEQAVGAVGAAGGATNRVSAFFLRAPIPDEILLSPTPTVVKRPRRMPTVRGSKTIVRAQELLNGLSKKESVLHAFYQGIQSLQTVNNRRLAASDFALLAAATGIEPFTPSFSLSAATHRWETRLGRWTPNQPLF